MGESAWTPGYSPELPVLGAQCPVLLPLLHGQPLLVRKLFVIRGSVKNVHANCHFFMIENLERHENERNLAIRFLKDACTHHLHRDCP